MVQTAESKLDTVDPDAKAVDDDHQAHEGGPEADIPVQLGCLCQDCHQLDIHLQLHLLARCHHQQVQKLILFVALLAALADNPCAAAH